MVTGFNTNVAHADKTFHVQTEDCPHRSLIRTVVFDAGQVVATIESPYAELAGSATQPDRGLSRHLEAQHWKLVKRLEQSGLPERSVKPEVKQVLAQLDRRIEQLQSPAATPARRAPNLQRALGAILLLALGWIARSLVEGDHEREVSFGGASPALIADEPAALPGAVIDSPSPPPRPTHEDRVVAALRENSVTPQPTGPPTAPATEPRTGASATALTSSPTPPHTNAPTPQAPTAAPAIPPPHGDQAEPPANPTAPAEARPLAQAVDWTGKLVPLADVDTPPWAIKRELPRYTKRAKRKHQQGSVGLNLLIDEKGFVAQVELLETIPDSDLNEATLELARLWQFHPARKQGHPVRVWKSLTLDFTIDSGTTRVMLRDG